MSILALTTWVLVLFLPIRTARLQRRFARGLGAGTLLIDRLFHRVPLLLEGVRNGYVVISHAERVPAGGAKDTSPAGLSVIWTDWPPMAVA